MNMLRWFRRTRPTPPPLVDDRERLIAAYWGYTPDAWQGLTAARRRYCRENVVHADRFRP